MDRDPSTHELLSHFDRPKTIDCPDFDWSEERDSTPESFVEVAPAEPNAPAPKPVLRVVVAEPEIDDAADRAPSSTAANPTEQTRGVLWVLRWAATLGVITAAVAFIASFGYIKAADHAIESAARAAVTEATLPRASFESIELVVARRLAHYPQLGGDVQLQVTVDGLPVLGWVHAVGGDLVTVTVAAPRSKMVPAWLTSLGVRQAEHEIVATVERTMPGRKVRVARN